METSVSSCSKVDKGCDEAARALEVMVEMGVAEEGGTMSWGAAEAPPAATSSDAPPPRFAVGDGRGSSTTVEGTAYAVLALVRGGAASAAGAYTRPPLSST